MRYLKYLKLLIVMIACISTLSLKVLNPEEGEGRPQIVSENEALDITSIDNVAWLEGHWCGKLMGGVGEEIWSEPSNGTMMGMYKHINKGSVAFYELMIIVKEAESLVLKLKHFNADLTAWEEKKKTVDFPLKKVTPTAIDFEGLTFRKINDNQMECTLLQKSDSGDIKQVEWTYHRQIK